MQQRIGGNNEADVTLGSVTSYISKVAGYVAGVTLGSVTSYNSA